MNTWRSLENPLSTRRFAPALLLHSPKTFFPSRRRSRAPRTAFNSLLSNDAAPRSETSKLPGRDAGGMRAAKWKIRTHSIRRGLKMHAPARAGKLLGHERTYGEGGRGLRPTSAPLSRARVRNARGGGGNSEVSFLPREDGPSCRCNERPGSGCECKARGTYRGSRRNGGDHGSAGVLHVPGTSETVPAARRAGSLTIMAVAPVWTAVSPG